jgi:hypothetical protein
MHPPRGRFALVWAMLTDPVTFLTATTFINAIVNPPLLQVTKVDPTSVILRCYEHARYN